MILTVLRYPLLKIHRVVCGFRIHVIIKVRYLRSLNPTCGTSKNILCWNYTYEMILLSYSEWDNYCPQVANFMIFEKGYSLRVELKVPHGWNFYFKTEDYPSKCMLLSIIWESNKLCSNIYSQIYHTMLLINRKWIWKGGSQDLFM